MGSKGRHGLVIEVNVRVYLEIGKKFRNEVKHMFKTQMNLCTLSRTSILTLVLYDIEGDSFDSIQLFLQKKCRSLSIRICHGLKVSPYRKCGLHRHHLRV